MKYSELERQKKVVEIMSKRIHDYEEEVKWYVERVVELEKQSHDYEVECEAQKKEVAILRDYARGLNHRLDVESFQGKSA